MFTDKIDLKDFVKMDPEYKDLLGRVLTIQADCEIGGPHLYVQKMLPAAPTKLDQLIVARTAAEEIDHFRKVARVAGDVGVDVSFVLSQPNEKRFVDAFRGLITTWEDNAVFGFLIDRVGRYQLEEFYDCSYLPLQRILPDIVTEELGHIEYGYNKTVELLSKGDVTSRKSGYRKPSIIGTFAHSTCSGTAVQPAPSVIAIGDSNDVPMNRLGRIT
jgi:1,2-phenylacetyl-CoA epoxidase catalytic subunit